MTLKSFKKELKKFVLNEAKILKELDHKNIIGYHNWYETRNHFWVIYEYLGGNNLRQIVEEDGNIEEPLLRQICVIILETLIFMHQKDIYFCDFKPSNFLLDEYSNLKFGDFILAQMKSQLDFQSDIFTANPDFLAPEIKAQNSLIFQANQNTEIFGFGSLMYYLASGKSPSINELQSYQFIQGYSQQLNELLEGCLQFDCHKRFSMLEIVTCDWISILKEQQQILKDMLSLSNNFDKTSDVSETINLNFTQNLRKQSNIVRMNTENFLDDVSMTIKNTQSEQNLYRKNSMNKDNISQKSVNYLDADEKSQTKNENKDEENFIDFQVPFEIFNEQIDTIKQKLLLHKNEKFIEHITLNDNIEKVQLGSIEEIIKVKEQDFQDLQKIKNILDNLLKKYNGSEETSDKTKVLKFIIKLINFKDFTNVLIKHQLYITLVNDLNKTTSQSLRYYLCIALGCIFRFVTDNVKINKVSTYENIFKNLIGSDNVQVSHKALGAFGEIMFYLYTQHKQNQNSISSSFLSFLANSLKEKINDIIYLRYAAKLIENCSSTQCGIVFTTQTFVKNLLLCMKKNKDSVLSSFCLNIFKYLLELDSSLVTFITTKDNISFFLSQIVKENHKISKDAINLLNIIFINLKPHKTEKIIGKIGRERIFQLVMENVITKDKQVSSKFVLFVSILITKSFHLFEYILQQTKIFHIIDQNLQQQTNIEKYFVQSTEVLHKILSNILCYWFDKWQEQNDKENINNQCIVCCKYLGQLSEVQFFIENYINDKNLMLIFYFGETITTQIDAQNYDILKSNYVYTLQNILKSDSICQKQEDVFIFQIVPFLIQSISNEKIESVLYMNFAIFIDIFNTFFTMNQIENKTDEMDKIIMQILELTKMLIKSDNDEEISINCFKIISTILIRQYIKNEPDHFNPEQYTLLIRNYIKDNYKKLNANIFSILIFILQQNQNFICQFQKYQLIDYSIQYLNDLNRNNDASKLFLFFYTIFEIVYKSQKQNQLPANFVIDIKNVIQITKKIYKDFFCKNVFEENMLNVFYYCFQILKNFQTKTQSEISLGYNLETKTIIKLKDKFNSDKILLKKIHKLQKMISQLQTLKLKLKIKIIKKSLKQNKIIIEHSYLRQPIFLYDW